MRRETKTDVLNGSTQNFTLAIHQGRTLVDFSLALVLEIQVNRIEELDHA